MAHLGTQIHIMVQPWDVTEGKAQSGTFGDTNRHVWGHNQVLWYNPGVSLREKAKKGAFRDPNQ